MNSSNNLVFDFKRGKFLESSKPLKWDNIHWWGGYKKFHIPSAPGAFYAAHLHWRWGYSLQDTSTLIPKLTGLPQLVGAGNFIGGSLLDPKVYKQNIKFAIIKNEFMPSDLSDHSSIPFEKVFKENKGNIPLNVKKGTDLVLYLSCEASGSKTKFKFNGTFFIHGLFFAHDAEPIFSLFDTIGSENEKYSSPSKPNSRQWERYPELGL